MKNRVAHRDLKNTIWKLVATYGYTIAFEYAYVCNYIDRYPMPVSTGMHRIKKVFELGFKLGYDELSIKSIAEQAMEKICERRSMLSIRPIGETRDNKKTLNTSNRFMRINACKHRYPSKKRSRRTWANFYALFPRLAKQDNWDGKVSDKMNKK